MGGGVQHARVAPVRFGLPGDAARKTFGGAGLAAIQNQHRHRWAGRGRARNGGAGTRGEQAGEVAVQPKPLLSGEGRVFRNGWNVLQVALEIDGGLEVKVVRIL